MTTRAPIDPRGLTVVDWASSMIFPLAGLATPRRLDDPDKWQEWAYGLIQEPNIASMRPPDPRGFRDWQEWAFRFNQVFKT